MEEVYISFATLLLTSLPTLSTLSMVEDPGHRQMQNLPSWVPDYSCSDKMDHMPIIIRNNTGYNCSLTELHYKPSISQNTLSLRGARFDHVVQLCPPTGTLLLERNLKVVLEFCLNMNTPYLPTQESRVEALINTMIILSPKSLEFQTDKLLKVEFRTMLLIQLGIGLIQSKITIETIEPIIVELRDSEKATLPNEEPLIPTLEEVLQYRDLHSRGTNTWKNKDDSRYDAMKEVIAYDDKVPVLTWHVSMSLHSSGCFA